MHIIVNLILRRVYWLSSGVSVCFFQNEFFSNCISLSTLWTIVKMHKPKKHNITRCSWHKDNVEQRLELISFAFWSRYLSSLNDFTHFHISEISFLFPYANKLYLWLRIAFPCVFHFRKYARFHLCILILCIFIECSRNMYWKCNQFYWNCVENKKLKAFKR